MVYLQLSTVCLLDTFSFAFEHQLTTCSPSKHPRLFPSLSHTPKNVMTLTCDYGSLWRSPAALLQTHTQAMTTETQHVYEPAITHKTRCAWATLSYAKLLPSFTRSQNNNMLDRQIYVMQTDLTPNYISVILGY